MRDGKNMAKPIPTIGSLRNGHISLFKNVGKICVLEG
jgi:hypothetical protein